MGAIGGMLTFGNFSIFGAGDSEGDREFRAELKIEF